MAETVGRAEIDVDIDGRGLEAQVRALGQQIGRTLGRSLAQTFGRQMRQLSSELQGSLDKMADQFGNLDKSINRTGVELSETNARLRDFDAQAQETSKELDRMTDAVDRNNHSWRQLPHGLRQVVAYTALFAAMGDEIAVLGSVAGSSLAVLGGAAGAAAVGIGTTIAAFQDMTGEISELPAAVQPAAIALQSIGDAFAAMQDRIQIAALDNAAGAFDSLRTTVEALIPSFEVVGESIGRVIDAFAQSIAPGTAGFQNLVTLIESAGPIFETLSSAVFIFGEALGNVFVLSIPFVETFAGWLQTIAQQFLDFTITNADAITEWFNNGLVVMQALGPLVGAVADALASLVTPQTVAMTVEFINSMTEFIPILGQILGVIGELDLLNVFAEILLAIGLAIQPLIPALTTLAASISDTLLYAISALAGPLQTLLISLGPLLPVLGELFAATVAMALEAFLPLVQVIVTELIPALTPLLQSLIPLLPAFVQLAGVIGAAFAQAIIALMPIIIPLIDLLVKVFQALEPLIPVITLLIQSAIGPLIAIVQIASGVIGALIAIVVAIITPLVDVTRQIFESTDAFSGINDMINDSISFFEDWGSSVESVIQGVIGWIEDALGWFADLFSASSNAPSPNGGSGVGGNTPGFAAGGVVNGAQYRLTGEAGPEAIVPLNRPLSQVNPEVRELSRIAQGLGGSGSGTGKIVNVQPGAIVVQTVAAPMQVANAVIDRLVANAAI